MINQIKGNSPFLLGLIAIYFILGLFMPGEVLLILIYPIMFIIYFISFAFGVGKGVARNASFRNVGTAFAQFTTLVPLIVITFIGILLDTSGKHHFVSNILSVIITWFAINFLMRRRLLTMNAGDVLRTAQVTGNTGQAVQAPVSQADYSGTTGTPISAPRPTAPSISAPRPSAPNLRKDDAE